MSCLRHAVQLGRELERLTAANVRPFVIGGGSPGAARRAARTLRLPYPVLSDPRRETYHAYGLTRAFGIVQRSGTILIDASGVVRYAQIAANPTAALQLHELLAHVAALPRVPEAP